MSVRYRSGLVGWTLSLLLAIALLWGWGKGVRSTQAVPSSDEWPESRVLRGENLLRNGSMDEEPFYWRPTNHYIAGGWYEWWVGDHLPEFIDGGIIYHNVCYPPPPPGKICVDDLHNSSQGYIRWGKPYIAGIYQPVSGLTPCLPYTLRAYNRNDSERYRPRVGVDPTGWMITRVLTTGLRNCPPDGASLCPDPRLESEDDFPATMIWSDYGDHTAYTWAPIDLTFEPISTTVSVWLYAAPLDIGPLSTYWDSVSLRRGTFSHGTLPEPEDWTPTDLITAVQVITVLNHLWVDWTTVSPTLGQIWYTIIPSRPTTSTATLSYTLYLPLVERGEGNYNVTPLDYTYATTFTHSIGPLNDGDTVRFVILAHRLVSESCRTEVSAFYEITVRVPPLEHLYLPLTLRRAQ